MKGSTSLVPEIPLDSSEELSFMKLVVWLLSLLVTYLGTVSQSVGQSARYLVR